MPFMQGTLFIVTPLSGVTLTMPPSAVLFVPGDVVDVATSSIKSPVFEPHAIDVATTAASGVHARKRRCEVMTPLTYAADRAEASRSTRHSLARAHRGQNRRQ
jgi:hypothetical protein